jgi:hypothetical protein
MSSFEFALLFFLGPLVLNYLVHRSILPPSAFTCAMWSPDLDATPLDLIVIDDVLVYSLEIGAVGEGLSQQRRLTLGACAARVASNPSPSSQAGEDKGS